ncbi:MAG: hypothetical protein Q8O61_13510, partial [Nocardioides sp.]|nr:hypothetical protein [Nocardioides sp.]
MPEAASGARRGVRRATRPARSWRTGRRPAAGSHSASARPETPRRSGGARARRRGRRRTHGLPGTLGLTVLGAVLPGSGYLYAGRRAAGGLLLAAW